MIHSVDSLKLAREIKQESKCSRTVMDVLIEINLAEEESKQEPPKEKSRSL